MKHRFPHPLTLLLGCIIAAAALTYVLPAGQYDRIDDPNTGRSVVVSGSFHGVDRDPVNLFEAIVAIPVGLIDAGEIVFLIFLIGGAFAVVDQTGALRWGVEWLVDRLHGREMLVIPIVSVAFGAAGAASNMQEEIIAMIPPLLVLTSRLGVPPITAALMSAGPAFVGSAFSPINPFQVGLAQRIADLPMGSGSAFRTAFLLIALAIWIALTMRYATRMRSRPAANARAEPVTADRRFTAIITLVALTFAGMTYGLLRLDWGFNQLSALFFIMGIVAGVVGRLGVAGTAEAYAEGFKTMALAALLVGFARTIFIVLDQGRIVDTIVYGIFTPIGDLPLTLSALGMTLGNVALHVPVPSVTSHAVLAMPVLVPVSDLLGLSRQVTVLTYQMGGGLLDMITPTNGALLAILAAAKVGYDEWFRVIVRWYLALLVLGAGSIVLAIVLKI